MLRTARLRLVPVTADDVDVLHGIWTDPDVRRFLWDDEVIDRETAAEVVEANLRDWEERGYGLWLVHVDEEPAGFVGFRSAEEGPELLFGFLARYWHRGYATEAAQEALRYLFESYDFAWGATDPPNEASVRVMERLGMTFDRRGTLNGLDTVFYRIAR